MIFYLTYLSSHFKSCVASQAILTRLSILLPWDQIGHYWLWLRTQKVSELSQAFPALSSLDQLSNILGATLQFSKATKTSSFAWMSTGQATGLLQAQKTIVLDYGGLIPTTPPTPVYVSFLATPH